MRNNNMWWLILIALGSAAAQDPDLAFRCSRILSYALLPNPSDCGAFIFCNEGTPLEYDCHRDEIWSQEDAACVLGSQETCELWQPTWECERVADGPIAYPRECGRFINCVGGRANVVECPPGLIYLAGRSGCVVGNSVRCESLEHLCDEEAEEVFGHPEHCGAFIECDGNAARLEFCPADEIFSLDIKFCVPGDSNTCDPQPVESVCEGRADGLLAHPTDCAAYVFCENNTSTVERCQKGKIFVPRDAICVLGVESNCRLLPDVCDGLPGGYIIEHPDHCDVFMKCSEDRYTIGHCAPGQIFRVDMKFCVPGDAVSCTITPLEEMCLDMPFGSIFPHPEDCSKLVRCAIQHAAEMPCPQNSVVQPGSLACVPGNPETCQQFDELCIGKHEETIALPDRCDFAIHCQNDQSAVVFCPPGEIFDVLQKRCLPGNVYKCELLNCLDKMDGMWGHSELCNVFVRCDSEQISVHPCPPEHIFHLLMRMCTPGNPTDCEYDPLERMCKNRFSGSRYPHPTTAHCLDYVVCIDGEAEVRSCPAATVLRPQQLDCLPGDVETCEYFEVFCSADHEEIHPHPARCDVRIVCIAGEPHLQFCPEGEIVDPSSMNCVPGDVSECYCFGKIDGIYVDPTNCAQYVRCESGAMITRSCSVGEIFNSEMKLCVPGDTENCQRFPLENMCQGRPNGRRYPHPDDCSQFVLCDDEEALVESCGRGSVIQPGTGDCVVGNTNSCELYVDLCQGIQIGSVAHPESCELFITCEEDESFAEHCVRGEIWDAVESVCFPGNVLTCELLPSCEVENEGIKLPHPNFCDVFIRCEKEHSVLNECPPGEIFNQEKQICAFGDSETCKLVPEPDICAGRPDCTLIPDPDNCKIYHHCYAQTSTTMVCSPGHIFAFLSAGCVPGNDATCESYSNRCMGRPDGIVAFPDSARCNLFLACSGGLTSAHSCPGEEILSEEQQLCVPGNFESCSFADEDYQFCSDMADGRYAHPLLCYLFITCIDGFAAVGACQLNEVFDSIQLECVVADRSIC
ncbi:uncharacterized protein LOC129765714 [Toxorhynchites rutilus septentrionalis]|uniref:uncharacterized protein LOC129765714 n=1 Tax=Toxorhynchites rutilus septentrionalis TaxID=329112 RepID=UPI00247ADDF2|nr:uncharacterized protein LOC129765714 [Toxorhynchites rutilus septentrionalis]